MQEKILTCILFTRKGDHSNPGNHYQIGWLTIINVMQVLVKVLIKHGSNCWIPEVKRVIALDIKVVFIIGYQLSQPQNITAAAAQGSGLGPINQQFQPWSSFIRSDVGIFGNYSKVLKSNCNFSANDIQHNLDDFGCKSSTKNANQ